MNDKSDFWTPMRARAASIILILLSVFGLLLVAQITLSLTTGIRPYSGSCWGSSEGIPNDNQFFMYLQMQKFVDNENTDELEFIKSVDVLKLPAEASQDICLSSFQFYNASAYEGEKPTDPTFQGLCVQGDDTWLRRGELQDYLVSGWLEVADFASEIRYKYYFPFDVREVTVPLNIKYRYKNEDTLLQEQISPDILDVCTDVSGWETTFTYSRSDSGEVGFLHVLFQRPFAYRLMTVVVFGTILIMIGSLLFLRDQGAVMQVAVGILFSLWGIRPVLVPIETKGLNLIDSLILSGYLLFALAIIFRITARPALLWLGTVRVQENKTNPERAPDQISMTEKNHTSSESPTTYNTHALILSTIVLFALSSILYLLKNLKSKKYRRK